MVKKIAKSIDFLTISTGSTWQKLITNTRQLHGGTDFFSPSHATNTLLPNDILMFNRTAPIDRDGASAHQRYVFIAPAKGSGQVIVDQSVMPLSPGKAVLIFPWQFHHYANFASQDIAWLFITFDLPETDTIAPLRDVLHPINETSAAQLVILSDTYQKKIATTTNDIDLLRLQLGLLLHRLIGEQQSQATTIRPRTTKRATPPLLDIVGRYVTAHMDQLVSVSDVADHLSISTSHLREQFRNHYQISVSHYIRQIKLLHASRLLHTTNLSVSQIAQRCGYHSVFAFSRGFKQLMGQSPRAYRNSATEI